MSNKNKDYGLLFADDLIALSIFKKFGNVEKHINKYLKQLEGWLKKWRLLMAPQKCNYLVFSKNKVSESNKLSLRMFNENLSINESPCFLGIRFDRFLSFNVQINYLRDTCASRLNILKIVANRSFGLKTEILEQLYSSLIRSVLEYSSFLNNIIAKSSIKKLIVIQNKAIRIINHQQFYTSLSEIETSLVNLLDQLNMKYISQALFNKNELLLELWEDYISFQEGRKLKYVTLFCQYTEEIKELNI